MPSAEYIGYDSDGLDDEDQGIDALIRGWKWVDSNITFSFPDQASDYGPSYTDDAVDTFFAFTNQQQIGARVAFSYYEAVSGVDFTEVTGSNDGDATFRLANSQGPSTAYAYYPSSDDTGGDSWYGTQYNYTNTKLGTYGLHTMIHEIGHGLGLKHGQDTSYGGAIPYEQDSMEYSVMTYKSFVGHDRNGYSNASDSYAQSLMMLDIAAIQRLYGANFQENSGDTTYTFSESTGIMSVDGISSLEFGQTMQGNKIFRTIWDGNGVDTYDFSNYTRALEIDLSPGGYVDLDAGGSLQRAILGSGEYSRGHVFNALLHEGDERSLIENAVGGSAGDMIFGNIADNRLEGRGGDDHIEGAEGDDYLDGGNDDDTLYGGSGDDELKGANGSDLLYGGDGNDDLYAQYWGTRTETSANTLYGQGGNDRLFGASGADYLDGGYADDVIYGHAGNDEMKGSNGSDTLYGGDGNDAMYAQYYGTRTETSANTLYGQDGDDRLFGASGADYLDGGADNDVIYGHAGDDELKGNAGSDTLYGGDGNDDLYAQYWGTRTETSSNTLNGGNGNDRLYGADGDDILNGDAGWDQLTGEGGADAFVIDATNGRDTVYDFTIAEGDVLDLSAVLTLYNPLADLITDFVQSRNSGSASIISVDEDGSGANAAEDVFMIMNITNIDVVQWEASGTIIV